MMALPARLVPRDRLPDEVDVVALGENSFDFLAVCESSPVDSGGRDPFESGKHTLASFRQQPGGQMATAALGCARLGLRVRYIGTFGADEWSARSRAPLEAAGVEVIAIARADTPGRIAVILVDQAGERRVFEHRHPSLRLNSNDVTPEMIAGARVLLVDATHPEAALQAVRWARDAHAISIVDIDRPSDGAERLLEESDVVVVPQSFAAAWTGEATGPDSLRVLAQRYTRAALVVVTCGGEGALAHCDGRTIVTPAYPVDVVDTTGAGDAFRAGIATALLRPVAPASVEGVLNFASATAALNCRAIGAQSGLPDLGQVLACLEAQTGDAGSRRGRRTAR